MSERKLNFVLSAPRSGSTWLCNALNHHPEVFATEQRLFGQFCEVWKNNDGSSAPRITFDSYAEAFSVHYFHHEMGLNKRQFIDAFQRGFVNFMLSFASRRTDKNVVVDKITPYPGTAELVISRIRELFPKSKIIQLVRDGRDVVTSGTFDWLLKDAAGTLRHQFFVEKKSGTKLTRFFDDIVLEKWAKNWVETIDAFHDADADLQIRYESMIEDQPSVLGKIFRLLEVEGSSETAVSCADAVTFEKATGRSSGDGQPTAKARKGIVGDWKNYFTQQDGELFNAIAGQQLVALGYQNDPSWVEELPAHLDLIC